KNYKPLSVILLSCSFLFLNCSKKNSENMFSFIEVQYKTTYTSKDAVSLEILNPENTKIDSIVYFVNDKKVITKKDLSKVDFNLKDQKLGYQNIKAMVYFNGETEAKDIRNRIELVSDIQPKLLKYTIVNTYPHDTTSFTEGLEFIRDTLYESTGSGDNYKSYLRKYDYKTGKVYKQVDLDKQYFGEGITMINNKLYQLTYKTGVGFIYNLNTLKLEKTFMFDKEIEGWGMTNDGTYIYQTDGTEKIWKMNPDTQKMIDYVNVYAGSEKIKSLNELEYINGKMYGNVWLKDAIAVIDPTIGSVEGILNMAGLRKLAKVKDSDTLNGIAYNPKTKTIFVTGKNWDKMFEIKVSE
ncbi:MAG: glutaminyl-peptide cyclotransferase, partial [Flavobacterium sp.]|nr:glutaminyl-peptide cyclotransferase [Flavobacterium sp.]